jgi:hypothetical protein
MDWNDIKSDVAKVAPFLGLAIGGPAGVGLGTLLASALGVENTPSDVQHALLVDPLAAVKIKELETQVKMANITAAASQVQVVNETLQADARGDSYWQKSHHAFECSFTILMVAAIYILLPILKVPAPNIDPTVWIMIGGILGVTAWQHGEVNKKIADQP